MNGARVNTKLRLGVALYGLEGCVGGGFPSHPKPSTLPNYEDLGAASSYGLEARGEGGSSMISD